METKKKIVGLILLAVFLSAVALSMFFYQKEPAKNLKTQVVTGAKSVLSFSPATVNTTNGSSFLLDAKIDPNGNQVTAVDVKIDFPTDKIQCDTITANSSWSVLSQGTVDNSGGKASIVVGIAPGSSAIVSSANVASLACKAKNIGTARISFNSGTQASGVGETGNIISSTAPADIIIEDQGGAGPSVPPVSSVPTISLDFYDASNTNKTTSLVVPGNAYLRWDSANATSVKGYCVGPVPVYSENNQQEVGTRDFNYGPIQFQASHVGTETCYFTPYNGSARGETVSASIELRSSATPIPSPQITNGSCGSDNGGTFSSAPSSNLCSSGNQSSLTGNGPWYWTCNGVNGGSSANCSANRTAIYSPTVSVIPVTEYTYSYTSKVAPASGTATNVALILTVSAVVTLGVWIAMKKVRG